MNEQAELWLDDQHARGRSIVWIIDRMVEPDPIVRLFGAGIVEDYVNLYLGTEYSELAEIGPWLLLLSGSKNPAADQLLASPDQNWGWLGSADKLDLPALAQHWRDRLRIDESIGPSLLRFHDNRVIARCVATLDAQDQSFLFGPLASALYWDGQAWRTSNNSAPGHYPVPQPAPWLLTPEPEHISKEILRTNLLQWALEFHSEAAVRIAETQSFKSWLDGQIALAECWQWRKPGQLMLLVAYRLYHPDEQAISSWVPLPEENPSDHFARCQSQTTPKDDHA